MQIYRKGTNQKRSKKKALCEAKACLVSTDSLITHTNDLKTESQLGHTIHD